MLLSPYLFALIMNELIRNIHVEFVDNTVLMRLKGWFPSTKAERIFEIKKDLVLVDKKGIR